LDDRILSGFLKIVGLYLSTSTTSTISVISVLVMRGLFIDDHNSSHTIMKLKLIQSITKLKVRVKGYTAAILVVGMIASTTLSIARGECRTQPHS
jgi:hypothetical protein